MCVLPYGKSMRAGKQQWVKKVQDLEDLIDAAQFKVNDGEQELSNMLKDMNAKYSELVATRLGSLLQRKRSGKRSATFERSPQLVHG